MDLVTCKCKYREVWPSLNQFRQKMAPKYPSDIQLWKDNHTCGMWGPCGPWKRLRSNVIPMHGKVHLCVHTFLLTHWKSKDNQWKWITWITCFLSRLHNGLNDAPIFVRPGSARTPKKWMRVKTHFAHQCLSEYPSVCHWNKSNPPPQDSIGFLSLSLHCHRILANSIFATGISMISMKLVAYLCSTCVDECK